MVAAPITTSATQKAMSQLCCLAIVLKGSPAMKAPTVTQQEKGYFSPAVKQTRALFQKAGSVKTDSELGETLGFWFNTAGSA